MHCARNFAHAYIARAAPSSPAPVDVLRGWGKTNRETSAPTKAQQQQQQPKQSIFASMLGRRRGSGSTNETAHAAAGGASTASAEMHSSSSSGASALNLGSFTGASPVVAVNAYRESYMDGVAPV